LTDASGWEHSQYYETLQLGDINGDGQAELLARSAAGLLGWQYHLLPTDLPVLFQAPGYEVSYSLESDPSLPGGTYALAQVVPAGDSNTFRCTLFNTHGYRVAHSLVPSTAVSAPLPLTCLPGRCLSAHLSLQGRSQPDLVLPVHLPDDFATLANQRRITFTWSVVPATWPAITTIFDNDVSLDFDGSSALVDLKDPDDLQISGPITVQAWLKPTANDGVHNIIAHGYTRSPNAEVYLRIANGTYQVGSWDGSDHVAASPPMPLSDLGRWVHLCGVYDAGQWTLYRNGLVVASSRDATGALTVRASWAIGARVGDGTTGAGERFFAGRLRNIALWKTARTAHQVQTDLLQAPKGNEPELAAFWGLTEGEQSTVNAIGQGSAAHAGMLHGGASWSVPKSLRSLLQLPPTPFSTFQTEQARAYATISQALDQSTHTTNLRSKYVEEDHPFETWASVLQSFTPPSVLTPTISATDWQSDEWSAVRYILQGEVQAVDSVWKLKAHTDTLLTKLAFEQQNDKNWVIEQLKSTSTNPGSSLDQVSFWIETILSAAIGVLSIVPESRIFQVALLTGSYLIGDLASLPGSSDQSPSPGFEGIEGDISSLYTGLSGLNYRQSIQVLKDALLLPIVGRLANNIWPKDPASLVNDLRKYLRLGLYQAILPLNYVISVWLNNPTPDPIAYEYVRFTNGFPLQIGVPSYAYWATPGQGSSYSVYVIHDPSLNETGGWEERNDDPTKYPSQAALNDLFSPVPASAQSQALGLGITKEAFFTGIDRDGISNPWENIVHRYISTPYIQGNI
jgi:hypothetical protein